MEDFLSKYFIYGLIDPRNGHLRYIGQTRHGDFRRPKSHGKHKNSRHSTRWVNLLKKINLKPEIIVIQYLNNLEELNNAEIEWIRIYKNLGCDLTNHCDGGKGVKNPISSTRIKMSKARGGGPVVNQFGGWWPSGCQAAKELDLDQTSISAVIRGRRHHVGGHIFRFADNFADLDRAVEKIKNKKEALISRQNKMIEMHNRGISSEEISKKVGVNEARVRVWLRRAGIRKNKKNKNKYIGISYEHQRYHAQISKNYKKYNIGIFDTPEEAAKAYDKKAFELYGAKAKLNFPEMYPKLPDPTYLRKKYKK